MCDDRHKLLLQKVEDLSRELAECRSNLDLAEANLEAIRHGDVDRILGVNQMLHLVPESSIVKLVKKAEAQAIAIFQHVGIGLITIDNLGSIHHFNPAAEKIFGYKANEIIGQSTTKIILGRTNDHMIQDHLSEIRTLSPGKEIEVYAQRKNEEIFSASLFISKFTLGDQKMLIASVADITEKRRNKEELELLVTERTNELAEAIKVAETANKAKDEFLSSMSHELRTPMNSVIGFLDLALSHPGLPSDLRKDIETANRAAINLLGIINDILDLQKAEVGKIKLEKKCFQLKRGLTEVIQEYQLQAVQKGISLELDYNSNLEVLREGDFFRLRQILINLIGNALKFTNEGSISVLVYAEESRDGDVHFCVSDTGIGIPKDRQDKVFDYFTQANGSTSRTHGGTGLGLSIARKLVELMDGRIWVESNEGVGSSFHFTVSLPVAGNDIDRCDLFDSSFVGVDTSDQIRVLNVLVAEDVAENAELVKRNMERGGHRITWVKNGGEAVEAFTMGNFDLILMDVQMPEIDGYEATRLIREIEKERGGHTPIIALTASALQKEKEKSFEVGMDSHVSKPINFSELYSEIQRIISHNESIFQNEIVTSSLPPMGLRNLPEVLFEEGLARYEGDVALYQQQLSTFPEKFGNYASLIKASLNNGNFKEAVQLAHRLKGVAGNLSMPKVYKKAAELETGLKKRSSHYTPLLKSLAQSIDSILPGLQNLKEVSYSKKSSVEVSQEQAFYLIKKLKNALGKNERDSETYEELRAFFAGNSSFENLEKSVQSFNFKDALLALSDLKQSLNDKEK